MFENIYSLMQNVHDKCKTIFKRICAYTIYIYMGTDQLLLA